MKHTLFSNSISSKLLQLVFLFSIPLLFVVQTIDYINFGVDDVFISMRVAENVAHGDGFVFNVGANVEGYSNPLWVAFLALGALQGFNSSHGQFSLLWFAKGMSFFFGIGVLVLLFFIAKNLEDDSDTKIPLRLLVVLVAVSCGPFVLWCCGGLESTLSAFFLTLSIFIFQNIRKQYSSGKRVFPLYHIFFSIILALAALTRPETILHAVSAIIFLFVLLRKKIRTKEMIFITLPFLLIFTSFMIWRYFTYHDLLPNTFYAKTGGGLKSYIMSTKYLFGGVCMIGGPLMLAIPFAFLGRISPLYKYCIVLVCVTFIFIIYSGGDWMAGYRFFIPVAPVFFLLIAVGIVQMITYLKINHIFESSGIIKIFLFILLLSYSAAFAGRILIRGQIQTMTPGFGEIIGHSTPWHVEIGNWIHSHSDKPIVVATGEAGVMGYLNMSMKLIDLLGLMDKHIAYERKHNISANENYVLDQKPDYILLYGYDAQSVILSNTRVGTDYYSAIACSRRFREEYHLEKNFISMSLFARNK